MGINNFKELSQYKNLIMIKLTQNENLMKLIYYGDMNPLNKPALNYDQIDSLIYTKIFPYMFVPEIKTENGSYITMKFSRFVGSGGTFFKEGFITFFLFCHKNLVRTVHNGSLRYDLMLQEIENTFNKSRGDWIGKMLFEEMDEIIMNENYFGVQVTYKVSNFN